MYKKHEVIPITDGYVIVDKEAEIKQGEICVDSYLSVGPFADLSKYGLGYDKTTIHLVIASIGIKIEEVPLIEEVEQQYSKKEVLKACELAGIRAGNANNYSEYYMKKEVLFYLKSLQKVPISVELEYAILSQWKQDENSHGRVNTEVLIVNPDNTITPKSINYE